ncbi:MAG: branched-chain amino acid ABC transporter substrate-binding protein [Deltaproteobacteria bacterium RIFOXYD12_FULL_50_9]|nr:MAG: branched-chain amino acid ABC transporter substrate-binding protein [Deltaproteobacteria bacterium RIFOXYD12_FULL_50_9]
MREKFNTLVPGIITLVLVLGFCLAAPQAVPAADDVVKIGLNYPETGPYAKQGLDQRRAADLAMEEINAAGGILGKKIELVYRDTKSNAKVAKENANELFDKERVPMIFGGSSSAVAIATGKVAKEKKKLFFGTLTYSTETTGEEAHRYIFRECYDSRMAAKVLSEYLKKNFSGKKYFYITADYTWGWTTEEALRQFTNTTDKDAHKGILTKLGTADFKNPLTLAQESNPDVLVLVLFGKDMENGVKQAYEMGLKSKMQIVVPNMTIDMAEGAGPEAMEGVLSATPWYWKLPFEKNSAKGMAFVNKFAEKYNRYPSTAGASAYVILRQYKEAVERAKTFETMAVVKALEGHKYTELKDEQQWREFDHQSVQTVFAVKCKKPEDVRKDKYQLDYYEVINTMKGEDAAITLEEWKAVRAKVGAPATLEE